MKALALILATTVFFSVVQPAFAQRNADKQDVPSATEMWHAVKYQIEKPFAKPDAQNPAQPHGWSIEMSTWDKVIVYGIIIIIVAAVGAGLYFGIKAIT